MTFSIVQRDPDTGQLGMAVCTGVPAVGMVCPWVEGSVGAVASQSMVNPYLGPLVLRELRRGAAPQDAIERALDQDPGDHGLRQLHVVDAQGRTAAFTGDACMSYCGSRASDNRSVAGNILVGPEVLDAMMAEADAALADGDPLPNLLLRALRAGHDAGGDSRGHVSAAMVVCDRGPLPTLRLHVERSNDPLGELESHAQHIDEWMAYMQQVVEPELAVSLA